MNASTLENRTNASSADPEGAEVQHDLLEDDVSEALTDDERVRRETDDSGHGARVTPGPADEERLSKAGWF